MATPRRQRITAIEAQRLIIDGLEDDSDLDDDSSESSAQECDVSYQNHADESSDDNFDDMLDSDVPTADISQPLSHSVSPDISPRTNDCWQDVAIEARLQKELADAAQEQVQVDTDLGENSAKVGNIGSCFIATIPSRAKFKFDAHDGEINAVSWSPGGHLVATGGSDRKVKLWEISSSYEIFDHANLKGTLLGSNASIASVAFDSQENLILGASNDFACRVWTLSDHRLRHSLTGHSDKVLAAKFMGESMKVVSGSYDRTLKVWDLRSRACTRTIFAGSRCNDLVTGHAAGAIIISGHFDKRIRFWDTRNESSTHEVFLQGKVTSLDLSSDTNYLLSCVRDDTLKLLDLRMNQVIRTFCADNFKVGCDWTRAVFSPDCQYITVGSHDGTVFIWNIANGKLEKTLKDHNSQTVQAPRAVTTAGTLMMETCPGVLFTMQINEFEELEDETRMFVLLELMTTHRTFKAYNSKL
ncbi:Autophagy-related protein 16-1 [Nymphon striatum]|nr:Autophagy-related protein 16-1 [Nymphon striatum]